MLLQKEELMKLFKNTVSFTFVEDTLFKIFNTWQDGEGAELDMESYLATDWQIVK